MISAHRLIEWGARLAEAHPYVWKIAWEAVHRLPALLPHDQSYNALRYFVAVRPNGLFLDIGANDGISVLSFRKFDKQSRIVALEPNPLLEPQLKKLKTRDSSFEYRMVGAGASSARVRFFVPVYRGLVLHTFTSASREQVIAAVARSFGRSVAAATEVRPFESEIMPGDELGLSPTIIKIDAEGFDYDVLVGLAKTIEASRPFMIIEIGATEYDKIKAYLDARDYVLMVYEISAGKFHPSVEPYQSAVSAMSGHRNFFAVPAEMVATLPS